MAEPKTKPTDASVDAFLDTIEDKQRREDCKAVAQLMQKVTKAKPTMWGTGIVGFGTYHYKYASGQEADWPLVGFSPRKQNLVLYIASGFASYDGLMAKLGKHKTGKVCVYLNKLADVDQKVLKTLIEDSVKYMKEKYK